MAANMYTLYTAGLGESVPAQMEQMSPSTVANAQGASAHKKQATQAAAAPAPRPAAFKQHQNPATAAAAKTALTLKALAHKSFAANFEVDAQLAARLAAEESHRIAPAVSSLASAASAHHSCPTHSFLA